MIPKITLPVIGLWLLAIVLALFDAGDLVLGTFVLTHHAYTGILFALAVALTIWLIVRGVQAEKAARRRS